MSCLEIPLWKQELLKRKQAKLGNGKSVSAQNSKESHSNSRNRNAVNTNLNHCSDNSVEKEHYEIGKNYGFSKQNNDSGCTTTKKCHTYNRNIRLDCTVDSTDTRQASEKSKILSVDTGPSRLDSLDARSNENIGKYNKYDFAYGLSGGSSDRRMQKSSEGFKKEEKSNRVSNDCEQDGRQELEINQGVERKHISPRDVKKMWQLQTTKEIPKTPSPSHPDIPCQITTKAGSNPSPVPKAYKSPYAKNQWRRPASVGDQKSIKKDSIPSKGSETESHAQKSSSSKSGAANDNTDKDNEVEHIQSVKSLLGLFGGQAKPNVNRKVSDNSMRTEGSKNYHTSEIKKPGLFKHNSEPNLYFNKKVVNDISTSPRKSPSSPKKSPTADVDALPSHHVSQGIQERMTRLRRASHSNMEDMDGFIEYQNRLNDDMETLGSVQNHESQHAQINQRQNPQLNDRVTENISMSHMKINEEGNNIPKKGLKPKNAGESTEKALVHSHNGRNVANILVTQKQSTENKSIACEKGLSNRHISKQNQADLFNSVTNTAIQNDGEKLRLSESVNNHSQISGLGHDACNDTTENHHSTVNNSQHKNKEMNSDSLNQPFDKLLSVFGPGITKKIATGLDLADANEHKYQNKQSNYVVENSESDSSLRNNVLSTDRSTGIRQNKQEEKQVIKNKETVKELEEKKPRRKGLNVVDPLAVLQLTKDPILLKEQPVAAELGLFKEFPSGNKPKVDIIKHEPDKKTKIAQINRAWDLDSNQLTPKQNGVVHNNMPASSLQVSPTAHNVPVTSIDEIPVSVIDDFATNKATAAAQPKSNIIGGREINIGNATFYNGALLAGSGGELGEDEEEFIPISSIDAKVDLGPPPEIVFDTIPGNLKSSFAQHGKV